MTPPELAALAELADYSGISGRERKLLKRLLASHAALRAENERLLELAQAVDAVAPRCVVADSYPDSIVTAWENARYELHQWLSKHSPDAVKETDHAV